MKPAHPLNITVNERLHELKVVHLMFQECSCVSCLKPVFLLNGVLQMTNEREFQNTNGQK